MQFQYKKKFPNAQIRREDCQKLLERFPEKIPVICEKDPNSQVPQCPKEKFLVQIDSSMLHFQTVLRHKIQLNKEAALFILIGGKHSISSEILMGDVYKKYKDPEDGFLYVTYTSEVTWG